MAPIWCTSSLKITLLRKVKCGINGKMTKIKDGRGKGNLKLSLSKFKPTSFYHHCTFCTYFANPIFQNMKSLSRMIYRFLCKNLLLCQYKMCCWESNGRGSKSFDPPRRLSPHNNKFSTVPIHHFWSKLKWSYAPELRKWVFSSFLFYAELQNVTEACFVQVLNLCLITDVDIVRLFSTLKRG